MPALPVVLTSLLPNVLFAQLPLLVVILVLLLPLLVFPVSLDITSAPTPNLVFRVLLPSLIATLALTQILLKHAKVALLDTLSLTMLVSFLPR